VSKLSIKIKKAKEEDVSWLWELFSASLKTQFPEYSVKAQRELLRGYWSKKILKSRLKSKNLVVYIACSGTEPAGYLAFETPVGGISIAFWLAVKKEFQGRGIGSLLLKKYEAAVKKQGCHSIHLYADKRNLGFYKKLGYKVAGFIPQNYYGADDYLLYKIVQRPKY
jgi:ribosomal protein S18 acetylase RimI-like enzyme